MTHRDIKLDDVDVHTAFSFTCRQTHTGLYTVCCAIQSDNNVSRKIGNFEITTKERTTCYRVSTVEKYYTVIRLLLTIFFESN